MALPHVAIHFNVPKPCNEHRFIQLQIPQHQYFTPVEVLELADTLKQVAGLALVEFNADGTPNDGEGHYINSDVLNYFISKI